ncbi:Deoxyribose-phosphate aldolase [Pseudovibrio axinellae]|uniref:Deoxyribose-phosphate aldolase n=1 Tax=Pseudovibrio axinellae TaxID=989403 RepID=A0A166B8I7_9HYPH|nr:deoxyribose-phosphate aldolase [Pseudovibrio axinellae]KZL22019.1 Deoxyribose-phosphate aldolase [Pseudovibrio axinellae]SEQ58505.1 deoxyribose-phosphate aldolase [Pseudovibrio axinellae]
MTEASIKETAKRALGLIDLTNLNDDCTQEDVTALIERSSTPYGHTAAICIWPRFIKHAAELLKNSPVRIATVVNFPAGGEDTAAVIAETKQALEDGADEIDLVMPYRAFAAGRRGFAEDQIKQVRAVISAPAQLKVILETGELEDPRLIHMASEVAIAQGADFIKTSTGKVKVNATLEAAEIMLSVLSETSKEDHRTVGFKPAGGVRSLDDAAAYLKLADELMGENWVSSSTFRFGASGLLDAVLAGIEDRENNTKETY